jgi:hypothetical protein
VEVGEEGTSNLQLGRHAYGDLFYKIEAKVRT